MTKGAKIALGCGCLFLLAVGVIMALLGFGAFWAKSKLEEATGGLDGLAAKAQQISDLERKVNAVPYAPPSDGVIAEARLLSFLESRKRLLPLYERHRDELETLQSTAKGRPPSVSEIVTAGGRVAAAFSEVRLAQLRALSDLGMTEQEYREIRTAVYESTWATGILEQTGKLPAEADPHASATPQRERREASRPAPEEAASTRDLPKANAELFRKYEAEIRTYAMTGFELLGI